MMLPPTILALFFLLPATPTAALSPPTCSKTYGSTLNPDDYVLALRSLPAFTLTPGVGPPLQNLDFFSRTSPSPRFRLPQRSSVDSCSVYVDLVDPSQRVFSPWWGVGDVVGAVVLDCADRGGGVGGKVVGAGVFRGGVCGKRRGREGCGDEG